MNTKRPHKKKGMTLLENVLALVITAMVITGLIQLFLLMPMHTRIANHRVSAVNLAQSKIEELKALGYNGVVTSAYTPPVDDAVIIDSVNLEDPSDDLYGIRTTAVTNITDGKKIVVAVAWSEFNKNLSETAEAIIYKLD